MPLTQQPPISPEAIRWAYRLFLDREPEDETAISSKLHHSSWQDLREAFVASEEFLAKNPPKHHLALDGSEPALRIDESCSERDLERLMRRARGVWEALGKSEPHWSVLTHDDFKQENLGAHRDAFFDSGKKDVERLFETLGRNGLETSAYRSCLEYGCGVGRITRWLGERFEVVHGYDISRPHLEYADEYLSRSGRENVALHRVREIGDLEGLPNVDVVFSVIVLQHNSPPVMVLILEALMRSLRPGGVAYLQVPTYRLGYEFSLEEYLREDAPVDEMEMHVLPQRTIFELFERNHARVLEVLDDGWSGAGYKDLSNTFLVQKVE